VVDEGGQRSHGDQEDEQMLGDALAAAVLQKDSQDVGRVGYDKAKSAQRTAAQRQGNRQVHGLEGFGRNSPEGGQRQMENTAAIGSMLM